MFVYYLLNTEKEVNKLSSVLFISFSLFNPLVFFQNNGVMVIVIVIYFQYFPSYIIYYLRKIKKRSMRKKCFCSILKLTSENPQK